MRPAICYVFQDEQERAAPCLPGADKREGTPVASRSNTAFQKRLKELARQEKQREKAEKRAQRKVEKQGKEKHVNDDIAWLDEDGNVVIQ